MSDVTELLVLHDIIEPPDVVALLSRALDDQPRLRRVEWSGAQPLWAAALSRVPLDEVIGFLSGIPWRFPQNVQVLIKKEADQRFQLWSFAGPSLTMWLDGNPDI
jgi:hypothetical protein